MAAFLIMPVIGGQAIWESDVSFVRMFSPAYLVYLLVLFKERSVLTAIPGLIFLLSFFSSYKVSLTEKIGRRIMDLKRCLEAAEC